MHSLTGSSEAQMASIVGRLVGRGITFHRRRLRLEADACTNHLHFVVRLTGVLAPYSGYSLFTNDIQAGARAIESILAGCREMQNDAVRVDLTGVRTPQQAYSLLALVYSVIDSW